MNDGGYVVQPCMCLYIADVRMGWVWDTNRLCKHMQSHHADGKPSALQKTAHGVGVGHVKAMSSI